MKRLLVGWASAATLIRRIESIDLPLVAQSFGIGMVQSTSFLASGLMNLNWQVAGSEATVAVKRLLDAPMDQAIRSLELIQILADFGVQVAAPLITDRGELVVTIRDAMYCALSWVDGKQPAGAALTIAQAAHLGQILGRVHVALGPAAAKAGIGEPDPDIHVKVADCGVWLTARQTGSWN